jgi:protein deglycase
MKRSEHMKKILVPLADGFEEIEAVTIIDVLRRSGMEVTTAGLTGMLVTGSHAITVEADTLLESALDISYDAVVLPGGMPGAKNLRENEMLLRLIRQMDSDRKWIGAICAAPTVLETAGILAGREATSFPAHEKELKSAHYQQDRVVVDGHVVTSRGAGTALEFSLKLVHLIAGPEKASELSEAMLAR